MENNDIKIKDKAIASFLGFLTLVIVYSFIWGPAAKYANSLMPAKSVTVNAEGKVTVIPDIAKTSFSVVSHGSDVAKIVDENNKKINKAIEFAKSQGIDGKDIQTTQYNLSPSYIYDEKTRSSHISGYDMTQTVSLKIRDFSKIGNILSGLPSLGINQTGGISFEVDDPEKYLSEARDKAFDKAKDKAKEMAARNSVSLGKVINFYESQGTSPIPYYGYGMGGAVESMKSSIAAPSIQPGSQEVTVQVSVTYEIK
jgi:hypothetical protein